MYLCVNPADIDNMHKLVFTKSFVLQIETVSLKRICWNKVVLVETIHIFSYFKYSKNSGKLTMQVRKFKILSTSKPSRNNRGMFRIRNTIIAWDFQCLLTNTHHMESLIIDIQKFCNLSWMWPKYQYDCDSNVIWWKYDGVWSE